MPAVTISYSSNPICASASPITVTRTGTGAYTGGTYSATPAGLTLNSATGGITPGSSTPGTYLVTYSTLPSGGCEAVTATTSITITEIPAASISYSGSPYCSSETSAAFTLTGTGAYTGGTYTVTPAGLTLDAATGNINPSTSTPGTYSIRYQIPASAGCAAVTSSPVSITITAKPIVNAGTSMTTCASSGKVEITPGTASSYATIVWSSNGDGVIGNPASLSNATYTPGPNDISSGSVTLTLTATGNGNCALVTSSKVLAINKNPIPVVIRPSTATFCAGAIQPLVSVEDDVFGRNVSFNSTINNVAIPDNNFNGIANTIAISGIPAGVIIDDISVTFNVTHTSDKDLTINLKAPNPASPFYGELNLVNAIPATGTGVNFVNTVIKSSSLRPIQNFGTPPYTGQFAPQAVFGALGAAFATSFNQLYTNSASVNGNWTLRVADNGLGQTGTLNSWSITITYSVPLNPINVVWSPAADLYTDAAATVAYVPGTYTASVYAKPKTAGTFQYSAIAGNGAGCTTSTSVMLTGRPSPEVIIKADYCSDPQHRVTLIASTPDEVSFNWSNGATTKTTYVDEAHNYSVSVTNIDGCVGTNTIDVAQELVVNGDFTQGNIGFKSGYTYHEDLPGVNNELVPDDGTNGYSVGQSGQDLHYLFYGKDHTNNTVGPRNFMLVNGHDAITVWEQTVQVLPDTRYYYSAWAMNLTSESPARLRFEVNGQQVGTIAELSKADKPSKDEDVNLNNWIRFYYGNEDGWYSGTNTTAVIRIINLNGDTQGNDFGLDDISFATLSPFVSGPSNPGTNNQTVCAEQPIQPIVYKVGSGAADPVVTGLPADLKDSVKFDGLNLTISGSSKLPGIYNYTIATGGSCANPKAASGTLIINTSAQMSLTSDVSTRHQSTCIGTDIIPITYSISGSATNAVVSGLPANVFGVYDNVAKVLTISGKPNASGTFTYIIKTTGTCVQKSDTGTIYVSPASVGGKVDEPTVCLNQNVTLTLSGNSGAIVRWELVQ